VRQQVVARQPQILAHAEPKRRNRDETRLRVRRRGVHDLPEQRRREVGHALDFLGPRNGLHDRAPKRVVHIPELHREEV